MTQDNPLTHLNAAGEANMVDVSNKADTARVARASAQVRMATTTLSLIFAGDLPKGDVLSVARIAGIQGAKRCSDLIPLCHPLALSKVSVEFKRIADDCLEIQAECRVNGPTGVEMEALTAVSVAALTVYDMCKAVDRSMTIEHTGLLEKRGGKSGVWVRA